MGQTHSQNSTSETTSRTGANPALGPALGHVIECNGATATIAAIATRPADNGQDWAVGQILSIEVGERRLIGLLFAIKAAAGSWDEVSSNRLVLSVELAGEIGMTGSGKPYFSSGLSTYPPIGSHARRLNDADLHTIYEAGGEVTLSLGVLSQARQIPALVSADALLSRHFAVVGTTGTGKSTAVAMILHQTAEQKPAQRILVLDPHNEYRQAFGHRAHAMTVDTLDLPFWLLTLEEFARVIFRGARVADEDLEILREMIPRAKQMYQDGGPTRMLRKGPPQTHTLTVDSPTPYRIADLLQLLDEDIGSLEGARRRLSMKRLKSRVDSVVQDPRFDFLFGSRNATDRISDVLGRVFRIPLDHRPITVFELSGIPSDVVDSVVSVLCRLAFDLALASTSAVRTLVVCEEAHRYIPADISKGFAPTRAAISRIAKEGRKYGVSLGIVSQRPHELDPTILSQCNTIFAMRLGNDADQDVIRRAISNGSRSSIGFLSSLADRECIAFGKAVPTPMRMTFDHVDVACRPSSQQASGPPSADRSPPVVSIEQIVRALRRESPSDADRAQDQSGSPAFPVKPGLRPPA